MTDVKIKVAGLKKSFGSNHVLKGIDIEVKSGEVVCVIGPSGSGKSTFLRCLNRLEEATEGEILVDGESITDPKANVDAIRQHMGMVFQQFNLFPHMTVLDNLTWAPVQLKLKTPEEAKTKAIALLERVGLSDKADAMPKSLSGGQQQRVAIARALAVKPRVLLLDEPLGALDLKLRKDMQVELKNIQQRLGITFIYVTHDQEEALSMSDTVVVMDGGVIQQIGTPQDVYNEPKNAFVADFIGESNILDGKMLEDFKCSFSGAQFQCLDKGFGIGESVDVVVRPEDVDIVPVEKGMLSGTVTSITFKGVHFEIIVDIGGFKWMIQTTDYEPVGKKIGLEIEPDAIHIMKKSKYSGLYGDYSSFSDELEHLSDIVEEE